MEMKQEEGKGLSVDGFVPACCFRRHERFMEMKRTAGRLGRTL